MGGGKFFFKGGGKTGPLNFKGEGETFQIGVGFFFFLKEILGEFQIFNFDLVPKGWGIKGKPFKIFPLIRKGGVFLVKNRGALFFPFPQKKTRVRVNFFIGWGGGGKKKPQNYSGPPKTFGFCWCSFPRGGKITQVEKKGGPPGGKKFFIKMGKSFGKKGNGEFFFGGGQIL